MSKKKEIDKNEPGTDSTDDKLQVEKKESKDIPEEKTSMKDVCFICRRPESKTGKMFKLPIIFRYGNDCMHKTMDTVSQFELSGNAQ